MTFEEELELREMTEEEYDIALAKGVDAFLAADDAAMQRHTNEMIRLATILGYDDAKIL